ncbi:MAG TPA: hypothetical protein PKI73_01110 [Petrotogaceae bacterium]|nr:hypothetical protein [Petrotogaceae bacterium]
MTHKRINYLSELNGSLSYGLFSKPFILYHIKNSSSPEWSLYMKAMLNLYKARYDIAMEYINKLLELTDGSKYLYYLTLELKFQTVSMMSNFSDKETARSIYELLRKNLNKLNASLMSFIIPSVISYSFLYGDQTVKKFRSWSQKYKISANRHDFNKLRIVCKKIKSMDTFSSYEYFQHNYDLLQENFHPSCLSTLLDTWASAFCIKDPEPALEKAKEAVYLSAKYIDEVQFGFSELYTFFTVLKQNLLVYESYQTSQMLKELYGMLEQSSPGIDTSKEYRKLMRHVDVFSEDIFSSSYNTDEYFNNLLQKYYSQKIISVSRTTLYNIIKKKKKADERTVSLVYKTAQINDTDKIITSATLIKFYIRTFIKKNFDIIYTPSDLQAKKLLLPKFLLYFLSCSYKKEEIVFSSLLRKINSEKKQIFSMKEKKFIIDSVFDLSPWHKARMELILQFKSCLKKEKQEKFINTLVSLPFILRTLAVRFILNYERYRSIWKIQAQIPQALEKIILKNSLDRYACTAAFYCFDLREKEFFEKKIIPLFTKV